jgi:hypothetical protein
MFVLRSRDGWDVGLNDPTPVDPVGGNAGETRGMQRRLALLHALEIWGEALDSDVPIVVDARFIELGCFNNDGYSTLASAAPAYMINGKAVPGADPNRYYLLLPIICHGDRGLKPRTI